MNGNGDLGPQAREQLEARVEEFKRELAVGEERLRALEAESARVRETVLRLEGALLAYGEILGGEERVGAADMPAAPTPAPA